MNIGLGSGSDFERDRLSVFAEAGPEFRFTKDFSAFANIRGVRPVSTSAAGEHVMVLLGLRKTF